METKRRLVLKHKDGYYWSQTADRTKKLFDAKRFMDEESADLWLKTSIYAPDYPEEYTLTEITMTIEEATP